MNLRKGLYFFMVLTRKKLKNLTFSKKHIEKTKYKMYNHNIVRMFIYMWFSIIRRKQRMKKRILAFFGKEYLIYLFRIC